MVAEAIDHVNLSIEFRGAPARLFDEGEGEIVISGPAGTGKTRQILEWIHRRCGTERVRVLILRKTLESLKASALVTFQEQVLYDFDGKRSDADGVSYFGGNNIRPAQFSYDDTGSVIILGGLDKASKVLSTEYDVIYVNEATELSLDDWEKLTGRTDRPRLGASRPPSVVLGDCNPDRPTHWIKRREADGLLQVWPSVHQDNPAMWDRHTCQWTIPGLRYRERLGNLTGVRYLRLALGKWVAAEGQVYESWDPTVHVIDRFDIPADWAKYRVIDFGYINPFVCQWWALDHDGRAYRYRELYQTGMLVSDAAKVINAHSAGETYQATIADHDAEDRATLADNGIKTVAANKAVKTGIEAVQLRLRPEGDGRPRLFFLRNSLIHVDQGLREAGKPTCTEEEAEGYVWADKGTKEEPLKQDDHGMDTTRYFVMRLDGPDDDLGEFRQYSYMPTDDDEDDDARWGRS